MTQWYKTLYPNINLRIIAPFLIAIVIIASIGVLIVTRLVAGSIQERFTNQLIDSADAASNSIVDIERQQLAALRLMVFTDGIAQALNTHDTNALDSALRPLTANAEIDELLVFDAGGQSVLRLRRSHDNPNGPYEVQPAVNIQDWNGVKHILTAQADSLGDKFTDLILTNGEYTLYTSAPVTNANGHLVGGIALGLSTTHLVERISAQALSGVTLYNNTGAVLGSTLKVAKNLLTLKPQNTQELLENVQQSSVIREGDFKGALYQTLYAPFQIRSQPLGLLAVALPSNFIVERSSTSRDILALVFAGLFAAVALLGLLTARTITKPVERLVQTTRAIRGGDLSQRVRVYAPDELGELSLSFDHMTDQLVQRNIHINDLYSKQVQETARLDAILTNISDAVFVQDPHGKVLLRNITAVALIRKIGANKTARSQFVNLIRNPLGIAEPQTVALVDQFFSVLAKPVLLPSGELLGHVVVFRDITDIVEAERLKDQLILQMSHELRTPLSAARGYIDLVKMIEQTSLSADGKTFIDNSLNSLSTLERLINQVIDVSSVVSNEFKLHYEEFDLVLLTYERAATWLSIAKSRELELSFVTAYPELFVQADRARLGQIIDHVLQNACSYTLPGGFIHITVDLSSDGYAQIEISDTGVGIGADEIDRVFERLYRGHSADAGPTDARGLGLGLYLSKRIVEAHQGTIHLSSILGEGTTVTIRLPIKHGVAV